MALKSFKTAHKMIGMQRYFSTKNRVSQDLHSQAVKEQLGL